MDIEQYVTCKEFTDMVHLYAVNYCSYSPLMRDGMGLFSTGVKGSFLWGIKCEIRVHRDSRS